jgi:glycosyltransferase involved in cell wall biosynthesis
MDLHVYVHFPPDNALAAKINELMRDEKLRERFGKAGRLRAEKKFSWRAIARETKSLYQSLIAKKAAA